MNLKSITVNRKLTVGDAKLADSNRSLSSRRLKLTAATLVLSTAAVALANTDMSHSSVGSVPTAKVAAAARFVNGRHPAIGMSRGQAVKETPIQLSQQRTNLRRTVAGTHAKAAALAYSPNWSGQVAGGTYQGLAGGWKVPAVQASGTKYSCTWIGLDGWSSKQLIQTGTEEDSVGGKTRYYAWFELLPKTQTLITFKSTGALATVKPGDSMWSYIYKPKAGVNTWDIDLQDITQGWTFSTAVNYAAPGASVEWVHEATTENNKIVPPPVFSKVTFTSLEYLSANTWYYTSLSSANEVDLVQNNLIYASAGAPTTSRPQSFGITYG